MTDKQQNLDNVQLQQLIMTFLNASPQEAQRIIEAKQEILLSDEVIQALHKQIEHLQQKLSMLEKAQKDYARKQTQNNDTNQQSQENSSSDRSSGKMPEIKTAESHIAAQEPNRIHAQQEASSAKMNIPQQPYIPRSDAEIKAMLASMTSQQFERVAQMLGNLSDAEITQLLQVMGRSELLGEMQISALRSTFQMFRGMGLERAQQFAEQIKAVSPEQIQATAEIFKAATIGQAAQRLRNLSPEEQEALVEDVTKKMGPMNESQKDMVRFSLQQLRSGSDDQVKDVLGIALKAQLTGEPLDIRRLEELQLPFMQNMLLAQKEPERAIETYTRELATLSREQNPFQWANAHVLRGNAYRFSKAGDQNMNIEHALEDFNAALTVLTPENSGAEWGHLMMMRAALYVAREQGRFAENAQQAVADCEAAMHVFPRETFPKEWAQAKLIRAIVYNALAYFTGNHGTLLENAIHDCNDALSFFTYEQQPEGWAQVLMIRCSAHGQCETGNLQEHKEQAIADANVVLKVLSKEQHSDDWAQLHLYRAIAYGQRTAGNKQDNLERAMADCDAALTVYSINNAPEKRAMVLSNRAMIRMELGHGDLREHMEQGIRDLEYAIKILKKETQPLEWAVAQLNCAGFYLKRIVGEPLQNWQKAYQCCNRALEVFDKERTPILWGHALVRRSMARYSELPEEFQQVLVNREGMMQLVGHGLEYLLQRRKSSHEISIASYNDVDTALTVLTKENAPTEWALAHTWRAQVIEIMNMANSKEYSRQADEDYEKAQTIFTPESKPFEWASVQFGRALRLLLVPTNQTPHAIKEKAEQALQYIDATLSIYTAEVAPRNYQLAQILHALAYERLENWQEAHKTWLEVRRVRRTMMSMAVSEQSRTDQEPFLTNINIYKHDAQVLLRYTPPEVAEAVIALEEGRAQGLRLALDLDNIDPQKIQNQQAKKRAETLLATREVWRQCQQRMEHLLKEKNITELSEERHQYIQELQMAQEAFVQAGNAIREYDNPDFVSPTPTFESIMQAISEPGDALVYLVAGSYTGLGMTDNIVTNADKGMSIIVMQDAQGKPLIHSLDLPLLAGLAIDGLYDPKKTSDDNVDRVIQQASKLGINDLVTMLHQWGVRKITFVPYGRLNLFPLAAIQVQRSNGETVYLGDLFEVSVAPSARAKEISSRRAGEAARNRQRQGLCLVGNPFPMASDSSDEHLLPELPGSEAEVDIIKQMARAYGYPSTRIHHLSRREAKKPQVVEGLQAARYAHLATHGTYKIDKPLNSRLVLAGNRSIQEQDRSITLGEILQGSISLSGLRLLVLSACDTSLIDLHRVPDEAIGLPAGFLQAGVAGVIASLWRVSDTVTYLLMARFARHYLDPQGLWSPTRALTEAQRWLRQEATNRVLATYDPLEDVIAMSQMPEESQKLYRNIITKIRRQAEKQLETAPDTCPYAHPRYWAAFIVTGC